MSPAPDVRALALSLPEATEAPHHGFPSFRVRGKIFATWPDEAHLHVLLDADDVGFAVGSAPGSCEELHWGQRVVGVRVALAAVEHELLESLLRAAWRRRAPQALRDLLDER